jgi:hypothetical protein
MITIEAVTRRAECETRGDRPRKRQRWRTSSKARDINPAFVLHTDNLAYFPVRVEQSSLIIVPKAAVTDEAVGNSAAPTMTGRCRLWLVVTGGGVW